MRKYVNVLWTSWGLAGALALGAAGGAQAQSEASAALSGLFVLPVASVVTGASVVAGAVVVVPAVLSTAGAVLVVRAVEVSARGTVIVLERLSDGARVSVELAGKAAGEVSVGVGMSVTVSVIGAGVVLSAAGEAIAFIPNALGRALLYNERVTR